MRKSRFTDSQILAVLKETEPGAKVPDLCRTHGMSGATFYKWRAKFGGMDASMMKRMKELEDENRRLKKMYAEERLKSEIRQEALEGKWSGHLSAKRWPSVLLPIEESAFAWRVQRSASVEPVIATNRNCPATIN